MQKATAKTPKHFRLDESLIRSAQKILGTKTETETIELALSEVVYQEKVKKFIKETAGQFAFRGLDEKEGDS